MIKKFFVSCLIAGLLSSLAIAKYDPFAIPVEREDFTRKEDAFNFGTLYGAQWAVYFLTQGQTIRKEGSFHNWVTHPFRPGFDRDSFDYNIFQHSLTGQFYYLFYRSQGYTEKAAFFWTFMSSLAFEFTIETVTEYPSIQDLYQTPVFGTVLGIGIEKLSRYLHGTENTAAHVLAVIINPMTLLPPLSKNFVARPTVSKDSIGAAVTYDY